MITKISKGLAAKRRAIANDVIAQIEERRFVPKTGVYMNIEGLNENTRGDLQCLLKTRVTKSKPCDVCALGSAFLSTVRLYDKFKVTARTAEDNSVNSNSMRNKLLKFFTARELAAIESSFERRPDFFKDYPQTWEDRNAWSLATNYREFLGLLDPEERLVWLMRSIADLSGEFITLRSLRTRALIEIGTNPDLSVFANRFI